MQISSQWNQKQYTDYFTQLSIGKGAIGCGFKLNTPLPDLSIFNFAFKYIAKPYAFNYDTSVNDLHCDGYFYSVPCAYTYYGPVFPYQGAHDGGRWAYNQLESENRQIYTNQFCPILDFLYNKLMIYIYGIDTNGNTVDLTYHNGDTPLTTVVGVMYYNGTAKGTPESSDTNRGYFAPLVYGQGKPFGEDAIIFSVPGGSNQIPFPILGTGKMPHTEVVNNTLYGKPDNIIFDSSTSTVKATPIYKRTKLQIVEVALQYGYIVTTSKYDAENVINNSPNVFYPTLTDDGVIKPHDYTRGEKNKNQRQYSWTNPGDSWNKSGFTGKFDPNDYTNKIDLTKPSLTTTGIFNRTFAMNSTNINKLADFLWNADETVFNEVVKGLALLGGNPIDGLIDLRLYPFDVAAKASQTGAQNIVVGRTDTKVTGIKINDYNAVLDLGSCSFYPYFNNFLDYEPFTSASLYIPYVGMVPISTANFMGKTISCKMVVDITTGSCTAIVFADDIPIIYKNGNIGVEIPMSGTNSAEYASRIMGGLTSAATDLTLGAATGNPIQMATAVGGITDSAMSSNTTIYNTAGSSSPACGLWQPQNCYFIINRPVPIVPDNYGHTVGYACNYQANLSSLSGFTCCYNTDVNTIYATEEEKAEIVRLLGQGVYL